MSRFHLFQVPSRQLFGRVLGRFKGVPGVSKLIRIRRKRFLAKIRSPQRDAWIEQVCQCAAGRDLQESMASWLGKAPSPWIAMAALPRAGAASRRCSVIINTVDRADDLELTLKALRQAWDASQDELIIVLGPGTDRSKEVIRASGIECCVIDCPERILSVSRNLGWQAASGRYLAFIDDDASPADGWLDALLEPLEQDPNIGVSAGFIMDGDGERFLNRYVVADRLGRAYGFSEAAAAGEKIRELGAERSFLTATGCNMAFRRSVLDSLGGFDPFYAYFLEETDVVLRATLAGYECAAAPKSRVFHRLALNVARKPASEIRNRIVVIRSQIHYIEKFGKAAFPSVEIENCLWERVLLDLEKIAWDSGSSDACGALQTEYLKAVANEFKLD